LLPATRVVTPFFTTLSLWIWFWDIQAVPSARKTKSSVWRTLATTDEEPVAQPVVEEMGMREKIGFPVLEKYRYPFRIFTPFIPSGVMAVERAFILASLIVTL
jgi:hypothetical protein